MAAKKKGHRSWSDFTEPEIERISKKCDRCQYRGRAGGFRICDYLMITGHMRGGTPDKCVKYKAGPQLPIPGDPRKPAVKRTRQSKYIKPKYPPATYIGALIDGYMQKEGLNCESFGALLGLNNGGGIRKWRNGTYFPGDTNIRKLASVMQIPEAEIRTAVDKGFIPAEGTGGTT